MATERQIKTLQNLATSSSMADAMRKAGYAETYARNPQQLKEKVSWLELLDKHVPEPYIGKKLKELSEAVIPESMEIKGNVKLEHVEKIMRTMKIPKSRYTAVPNLGVGWTVYFAKPDNTNRNSAIEKAIKARGGYAPDKIALTDMEGNSVSTGKIDKELQELEKELRISYIKEAKNAKGKAKPKAKQVKRRNRSKDSGTKKVKD